MHELLAKLAIILTTLLTLLSSSSTTPAPTPAPLLGGLAVTAESYVFSVAIRDKSTLAPFAFRYEDSNGEIIEYPVSESAYVAWKTQMIEHNMDGNPKGLNLQNMRFFGAVGYRVKPATSTSTIYPPSFYTASTTMP